MGVTLIIVIAFLISLSKSSKRIYKVRKDIKVGKYVLGLNNEEVNYE